MTSRSLSKLVFHYHAYVDTFREPSGVLPLMLRLKLLHSCRVVTEVRGIALGEQTLPGHLGEACALLHDTARYLQFHAFGTFRDSESFDHAACGVDIIQQQNWLQGLPAEERRCILSAVRYHNKREVPPSLKGLEADLVHLVRDGDKLDIFRILDEAVRDGSLEHNPEIVWGLRKEGAPNPEVVEAVSKGETVSYDAVRSFVDFVLVQVGWLNSGLHFETSARFARKHQFLESREKLLKTLTDDHESISRCCQAARKSLEGRAIAAKAKVAAEQAAAEQAAATPPTAEAGKGKKGKDKSKE